MMLNYPACCFEVKETAHFVVAAGNSKEISLEKVPCIQRALTSEITGAVVCKLHEAKLWGRETFGFLL